MEQGEQRGAGATGRGRLGRYVLLGTLGRGGMGEVVRARAFGAEGATKDLCIKRIRAERLERPGALERFVEEARLSLRLAHGNIVAVFDFGRAGDEHFLAMEWIDGADLREILHDADVEREPLPPAVAAHVGAEIARALAYAHDLRVGRARGVVHCDVKPGNVMIARTGEVKLTDFGVATAIADVRGGGTEGYLAPELGEGGTVGPSCDLYALGVVLGEMLLDRRVRERSEIAGAVPSALEPILGAMLARDPGERPRSAAEVAKALEAFVARERAESGISPRDELARRAERIADARREAPAGRGTLEVTESFAQDAPAEVLAPTAPTAPEAPAARPTKRGARAGLGVGLAAAIAAIGVVVLGGQERVEGGAPERAIETASAPERAIETASAPEPAFSPAPSSAPAPSPSLAPAPVLSPAPAPSPARDLRARSARAALAVDRASPDPAVPDPAPAPAIAPDPPAAASPAHLRINAVPWAAVELDGRAIGVTPLLDVEVEPGRHRLRFVNDALHVERVQDVEVVPGERRSLVIDLE